MTTQNITDLILAGIAVAGSIGSVLLLAYRVGTLTGKVEAGLAASVKDNGEQAAALLRLAERFDAHVTGERRRHR